jgi:hypothetical protein
MDRDAASKEIENIFSTYKSLQPTDKQLLAALKDGKLYELYVLSRVVENLANRGFVLTFKGSSLKFKASPGYIKKTDSHFEISAPIPGTSPLYLFVDIEFETLGSNHVSVTDNSLRHEIDIVVVNVDSGYPGFNNIFLGVECKAVANFAKPILKEVLGVRRELSLLQGQKQSLLSTFGGKPSETVPADPPSEYWLAYIDPAGDSYMESPRAFGVEFKHMPV